MSFKENLQHGLAREVEIYDWLVSRGNSVTHITKKDDGKFGGPRFFTRDGSFVAPDLVVVRNSKAVFVEVKSKTRFAFFRKANAWCTGVDASHFEEYVGVSESMGWDLWILFLHETNRPSPEDVKNGCPPECPTGLFGCGIRKLRQCVNSRTGVYGKGGMVLWTVRTLDLLSDLRTIHHEAEPQSSIDAQDKHPVSTFVKCELCDANQEKWMLTQVDGIALCKVCARHMSRKNNLK